MLSWNHQLHAFDHHINLNDQNCLWISALAPRWLINTNYWIQAQKLLCWLLLIFIICQYKASSICKLWVWVWSMCWWEAKPVEEKNHFYFYPNGLLLMWTRLFHLQPAVASFALNSPWTNFSPMFLLMLRALWTAVGIFTLHSMMSLRAAQIFMGTRPPLEYQWVLLCTLSSCVKRGPNMSHWYSMLTVLWHRLQKWLLSFQHNGLCQFIAGCDE